MSAIELLRTWRMGVTFQAVGRNLVRPVSRAWPTLAWLLLISVINTGCSTNQTLPRQSSEVAVAKPNNSDIVYSAIPKDSLYPLLLAELAGKRNQYEISLQYYLEQAEATQDLDIARRTSRIAQYLRRPEYAVKALDIWLTHEPNNPEALKIYTQVAINQQQWRRALSILEQLKQAYGDAPFDYLAAQIKNVDPQRYKNLVQSFDKLFEKYPRDPRLVYSLAILSQQQGDYRTALKRVDQALKIDRNFVNAIIQKARLLTLLNQPVSASEWLAKNQNRFNNNTVLLSLLGQLQLETEQYAAAKKTFERLVNLKKDNTTELLSLALIEQKLGNFIAAETILLELQQIPQLSNAIRYYLGELAEQQQQYERALSFYAAVEPSRQYTASVLKSARILLAEADITSAQQFITERRLQYPDTDLALVKIEAQLLIEVEDFNQAMEQLTLGLKQYPDNTDLLYNRAMLSETMNDLDALELDLRRLLEIDPDNIEALNALGYTLANRTERYADAYVLIDQALKLAPNNPAIIDSMGWLYFRQGRYADAEPLLRRAYELINDHEIAAHYGELLWKTNRPKAAREVWIKGLEHTPNSSLINDTRRRLGVQ